MVPSTLAHQDAQKLVSMLKGLAHPLRLRIVHHLCNTDACVNELCNALNAKQSTISQQLTPLRMQGLLHVERDGNRSVYSLADSRLKTMISCLTNERCNSAAGLSNTRATI